MTRTSAPAVLPPSEANWPAATRVDPSVSTRTVTRTLRTTAATCQSGIFLPSVFFLSQRGSARAVATAWPDQPFGTAGATTHDHDRRRRDAQAHATTRYPRRTRCEDGAVCRVRDAGAIPYRDHR